METCHWCGGEVCAKDVETRNGKNFCDRHCLLSYVFDCAPAEDDVAEGDGSDA